MDRGRPSPAPTSQVPTPAPSRPRRWIAYLIGIVVLGVLLAVGSMGWLVMIYASREGPGQGRVVAIALDDHTTPEALARRLGEQGLVEEPWLWGIYARVLGAGPRLRSGEVLVTDAMGPRALLQRLAEGYGAAEVRLTFPEGFNRFDIAARLARWGICSRAEFLDATRDATLLAELGIVADSAEGYLFPDTYALHDGLSAQSVVRRMVTNWKRRTQSLLREHGSALESLREGLGWGVHDVVVLASIVEKEAAVPGERPTIAGVFLNRLLVADFQPKRLQADPTVAYGCLTRSASSEACRVFDGVRVTRAMLSDLDNPYNTYRHAGLPPGPIANPGLSALRSVLEPARHDYFYFVAMGDGRHRFSHSLSEHNEAVDLYQRTGVASP